MAAAANQPLIVEDLLSLGAEANATDHQGRSVLHVAATYGLPGVLSVRSAGRSGMSGVGWLSRSGFQDQVLGDLPQLSSSSPSRLCLNRAFQWTWKPETSKVSWSWPGLVWQAGRGTGQGGCPGAAPSLFRFAGLTPLHTATLALNASMPLPSVCPRMLSPQARDRLACVQMLLQMGASHTSQVSLSAGQACAGHCLDVQGTKTHADLASSSCVTPNMFPHFSGALVHMDISDLRFLKHEVTSLCPHSFRHALLFSIFY